jgi:hypothetical protein
MINSPFGFSAAWAMIKRFLDPNTVDKISILGKDYLPHLLALIPAENLPKRFGGECECPGGCDLSEAGPWQEIEFSRSVTSPNETCTTMAQSEESVYALRKGVSRGSCGAIDIDGLAVPGG